MYSVSAFEHYIKSAGCADPWEIAGPLTLFHLTVIYKGNITYKNRQKEIASYHV